MLQDIFTFTKQLKIYTKNFGDKIYRLHQKTVNRFGYVHAYIS